LPEGGSATVVLVASQGTAGLVTNGAQVSYGLPDFRPADNSSTGTTQVNSLDQDQDGVEDSADCSPLDATVFAVPPEVTGVRLDSDGKTIKWDSAAPDAGSGMVYDLLRGSLGDLGNPPGEGGACLARGLSTTLKGDATIPRPGEGLWYLVRGENACGKGPLGTSYTGTPRHSCSCELSRTLTPTLN
jgi:hypothetical protein